MSAQLYTQVQTQINIFEKFDTVFEKYTKVKTNGKNSYDLFKEMNKYPPNTLISYRKSKTLTPYACMFKDIKGRYYADYLLDKKNIDICTNFQLSYNTSYNGNVLVDLILNDVYINIDTNSKILFCCAPNDNFYIRFTFIENPIDVTISYDAYMFCNAFARSEVVGKNYCDSGIRYYMCSATPENY
jgi:hypothetical protein